MQQHDTSLCRLYVIAYVLDIAFEIKPKSSRYIITLMKTILIIFYKPSFYTIPKIINLCKVK